MKKGYWVSSYFKIDNQENIKKYSEEDPRFWSLPKLLEDLVKQNKNFDSLN